METPVAVWIDKLRRLQQVFTRCEPDKAVANRQNWSFMQHSQLNWITNYIWGIPDGVQKVQFSFIVNCRDESTTRHGAQRFFEWLAQTGEEALVAKRAQARARIVAAIARATKV